MILAFKAQRGDSNPVYSFVPPGLGTLANLLTGGSRLRLPHCRPSGGLSNFPSLYRIRYDLATLNVSMRQAGNSFRVSLSKAPLCDGRHLQSQRVGAGMECCVPPAPIAYRDVYYTIFPPKPQHPFLQHNPAHYIQPIRRIVHIYDLLFLTFHLTCPGLQGRPHLLHLFHIFFTDHA